jgi:hypothetical protein
MSWLTDLITPVAGSFVKDVGDTVKQFVTTESDRLLLGNQLTQIEADFRIKLEEVSTKAEELRVQNAADINKTMQSESVSDHWPTYTWRPFIGFVFGVTFFGVYFVLPILKMPVPVIPFEAWTAIGAILGVASWYRGKMQADPSIPTDNRG